MIACQQQKFYNFIIGFRKVISTSSKNRLFSVTSSICTKNNDIIVDQDDDPSIIIPPYVEKIGETLEVKKARLLYQSRKRGMLENGLLLSTFAAKYLDGLNEEQTKLYDQLINQPSNDWEIYYWATEAKATPKEFENEVMTMLKNHVKTFSTEIPLGGGQPELH